MNKSDKHLGFTLIELVAVIAVICLLIAILLPALSLVRKLCQRTICQGNLKQVAFAWNMYLDDNDGLFYQNLRADTLYGGWKSLKYPTVQRPLNHYLSLSDCPEKEHEAKVLKCPCDTGDIGTQGFSSFSYRGTSYRTNILLIGQEQIGPLAGNETDKLIQLKDEINKKLPNLHRNQVDQPGRLLLIGDAPWGIQWLLPPYEEGPAWHDHPIHYNLAYLDCHISFLQIHKGIFVADDYTVIPFSDLYALSREAQLNSDD